MSDCREAFESEISCLILLADIRHACGDNGLRMQDELVKHIEQITEKAKRWDEHQKTCQSAHLHNSTSTEEGY